ncbi:serine/arginine repetitive matrix protein 2-like [Acanthaster planci]|uniref:Serine/arginine repetitive matrix protein 2-like n=1 Tax=Acanthaster planci TaxID=133434 RepID=A0A8B7ZPY0_ACAPL|nr:serine/arginine repetitive matrix protein 2-like [Acanthaster planci]
MSAEKDRRYQEVYRNRFVNPIDQGVGRRTGWVLNREVRKDSEGYEVFDDYWSDSGDESVDLSLRANKENKGKAYKLSSPLKSMPDFTPSSRASTDVEPLSDIGLKAGISTSSKTSNGAADPAKSVQISRAKTSEETLLTEVENGTASMEDEAEVAIATPSRDGGIQESDITGSIIKGGNSFQVPNSALQEFKTKTRLSFGNDVDNTPRTSTRRSSARAVKSHCDDGSTSSEATLKGSQSDENSEGLSTAKEEMSPERAELGTSVMIRKTVPQTNDKTHQSVEEISSEKDLPDEALSKQMSDREIMESKNEAVKQKPTRKSTSGRPRAPKQPTDSDNQETTGARKSTRRRKRNVRLAEEDTSGDEGMFISLHKSVVNQQDRTKEAASDVINIDRNYESFHDADDEEMVEIVDDDSSYKSTLNPRAKSRGTVKRGTTQTKSKRDDDDLQSKTQSQRGKQKKADKQEAPAKDFVDLVTDEEVPSSTKEITESMQGQQSLKGSSSEESKADVEKARQQPKTSQSRRSKARSRSRRAATNSSDIEKSGANGSNLDTAKRKQSRRRQTKTAQQSLSGFTGSNETSSTGTDEDDGRRKSRRQKPKLHAAASTMEDSKGAEDVIEDKVQNVDSSKVSRKRNRSLKSKKPSDSETVEEAETEADTNGVEAVDQEGLLPNSAHQEKQSSFKRPTTVSRISARKKRTSVHFCSVEVISDEPSLPTVGEVPVAGKAPLLGAIKSPSPQHALDVDDSDSSPRKKFKGTSGVKLVQRCSTSRRSEVGEEKPDKMPPKRTSENAVEAVVTKKQSEPSLSPVVRGGRKRGGKRKLYSGDLPSSFLNDPSVPGPPSAAGITSKGHATAEDKENPVGSEENPTQEAPVKTVTASGRGRGRTKGRGRARGGGTTRKMKAQEIQGSDDVVLNFLNKYESGKESESTDSEGGPVTIATTEAPETMMDDSTGSTPSGGMCTTVYPEPTPRSILKDTAISNVNARKKNLTLQFFEVPKRKPIIGKSPG